jgi:hypothetical protein
MKSPSGSPEEEIHHLHEIPAKYIRRGTKARSYSVEIYRTIRSLQYTDRELEYASQICVFNIQSLMKKNGYQPLPQDLFDSVEKYVYHYENYCYRLFTLREKVLQFLNAAMSIGYTERDATIKNLLINPTIKKLKLDKSLSKFDTRSTNSLGKIIKDRHGLTHKLYYGQSVDHFLRPLIPYDVKDEVSFKEWCKKWKEEITSRTKLVANAEMQVSGINHELTDALMSFFLKKTTDEKRTSR